MIINIRQKGQEGEREIQRALEPIVRRVMQATQAGNYPLPDKPIVQRNQNQSAVGGNDLSNTFGMSIEVKRQEQLSVNTWWQQCTAAAERNNEHPVLLYRQNRKKWRCVTLVWLHLPGGAQQQVRAEFDFDTFLHWFEQWVLRKISGNF
jgi:Holliday junction resolvase